MSYRGTAAICFISVASKDAVLLEGAAEAATLRRDVHSFAIDEGSEALTTVDVVSDDYEILALPDAAPTLVHYRVDLARKRRIEVAAFRTTASSFFASPTVKTATNSSAAFGPRVRDVCLPEKPPSTLRLTRLSSIHVSRAPSKHDVHISTFSDVFPAGMPGRSLLPRSEPLLSTAQLFPAALLEAVERVWDDVAAEGSSEACD